MKKVYIVFSSLISGKDKKLKESYDKKFWLYGYTTNRKLIAEFKRERNMELYKIIKKRMPEDEYKSFQMRYPTSELIQMELSHVDSDEFGIRKESLYPIIGTINDQVFHDDLFSEISGNLTDFIRHLVRSYYEPNCGLPFNGNTPIFDIYSDLFLTLLIDKKQKCISEIYPSTDIYDPYLLHEAGIDEYRTFILTNMSAFMKKE